MRAGWIAVFLGLATRASAVPLTFDHQGRVLDPAGAPVDGTTSLGFALYATPTGGAPLWSETQSVPVSDGYYQALLGATTPIPSTVFSGLTLYLGVSVGSGPELVGRSAVVSVPYAVTAQEVRGGRVEASEIDVAGGLTLGTVAQNACTGTTVGLMRLEGTDVQVCDGARWRAFALKKDGAGDAADNPALTCQTLKDAFPSTTSGTFYLDPNGGSTDDSFLAWCEMIGSEGWTKLESSKYPHFFTSGNWTGHNTGTPAVDNYSNLGKRTSFASSGCYTFRLEAGHGGVWTDNPTHTLVWRQCHDPFTQSTNGAGYTFLSGEASTTCGGFNGLHNRYTGFSYTSDPDSLDSTGCWWMQIVPHTQYSSSVGYLDGWGGSDNYHQWQALYVK
jgi:hypothetical protein